MSKQPKQRRDRALCSGGEHHGGCARSDRARKVRGAGHAPGAPALLEMASQLLRARLLRHHVRCGRFRPVRRRAAADRARIRPRAGASRSPRHRRPHRRVPGRAVLGHHLRLYRPAHRLPGNGRHLLGVHRAGGAGLEHGVARRVPLPVEFRARRRSAGDAHLVVRVQPRPHPREHGRQYHGGFPGRPGGRRRVEPRDHPDARLARAVHRRRGAGGAPLLRAPLHAGIGALSSHQGARRRGRGDGRGDREGGARPPAVGRRGQGAAEPQAGDQCRDPGHRARAAGARAAQEHAAALGRVVRLPMGVERHPVHAADDPAAARDSADAGDHLHAGAGGRGLLRLFRLRLPDRPLRPPAGAVPLLFHRRVLPPVVRDGERPLALLRRRRGRLGQSRRLRRDWRLCQRAAPDAFARHRRRLVLRHRPHRLVPGANRGRLHAGLRRRRLRAAHVRTVVPDRGHRTMADRHRDQGPRARGDHGAGEAGVT